MKNPTFIFLLLFTFIFSTLVFAQDGRGVKTPSVNKLPSQEKRWAVVVGVNNFGLQGAVNDAKALKDVLVKYAGFPENQVILLTTDDPKNLPTRRNIILELNKLSRKIEPDDLLLFAFSGHGKTINDKGFLIPADGEWSDNTNLLEQLSINVNEIKRAIEEMKVKQVLMLIDACRDHIESGQKGDESQPLTEAINRGFSFYETNKTVEAFVTLYAARIGENAYEYFDNETNQTRGYFSKAIEEALSGKANIANQKGEITLASLVKYVQETVPKRSYQISGKRQTPFKNSNDGFNEDELVLALIGNKINSVNQTNQIVENLPNSNTSLISSSIFTTKTAHFKSFAAKLLKYDYISWLSEGLAQVQINQKCGFIDENGSEIVAPKYSDCSRFNEGLAKVALDGKTGFINRSGRLSILLLYDSASSYSEGLASVTVGNKFGFIDKTGTETVRFKYDDAGDFHEGLAKVCLNLDCGFVDKVGKETIPLKYEVVWGFSNGLAKVRLNGKWGFIDKTGTEVIPIKYESIEGEFDEELLVGAKLDGKYGFIDRTDKIIIPFQFLYVEPFSDGLARVSWENKERGLISKTGKKVVLSPIYESVLSFHNGVALFRQGGKYGLLDKTGREKSPAIYESIFIFIDGFAVVTRNGKKGVINSTGNEVIPIKYEEIWNTSFIKSGFVGVKINGKKGFVDIYGNEYFDF